MDLLKRVIKPLMEAFEKMPKRGMELFDGKKYFPDYTDEVGPPRRRFEFLMLALHTGNESNLERLLEGHGITAEQLQVALDTLSAEEIEWIQAVWDAAEALWPEAAALEERDSGLRPTKIPPKARTLKNGTLRGGYFPAVYHSRETVGQVQQGEQLAQFMDPSFSRGGTSHSYTKKRAEHFSGILSLEPTAIATHLAQVAHDVAFRETVKSVGSLLLDGTIQKTLNHRLGDAFTGQLVQWVKDIGQMRGVQGFQHAGWLFKATRALRSNTIIAALGFSLPNAIEDFSNLPAALARTDLKAKHLAAAVAELALHHEQANAFAESKSGELRARRDSLQRDLANQAKKFSARRVYGAKQWRWMKDNAFMFMEMSDKLTSTPVWLGSYRQALATGMSDADAVVHADANVRKVFPSHSAVDLAPILRDKGVIGNLLMFYGFLSTYYNGIRALTREFGRAEGVGKKAAVGGKLLAYVTVVSVFAAGHRATACWLAAAAGCWTTLKGWFRSAIWK